MGDVAQAEGDGIGVDAGIGDRQPLGVAAQPVDAVQYAAIDGAVAAHVQHGLGDVADDDPARTAAALDDAEGDVAGAAGDVEDGLAGARVEAIDEIELPQPVDAAAHQVVHQIVAAGHAVEDAADKARFLLGRDLAVAEIGGVGARAACLGGDHVVEHSALIPKAPLTPIE